MLNICYQGGKQITLQLPSVNQKDPKKSSELKICKLYVSLYFQ